jgi:L-alanine-DL-glutamate epimerase-like enolase superfamily enzyme
VTQTRNSPLDLVVSDLIAPHLLGKDALDITARRADLERELTAVELDGAVCRAWSAVEIALQDLRAQAAGWPLWRLLGGNPRPVDVELVEGYALVGESEEQFAERLAARVEQGYRLLKIEAGHYTDPDQLVARLALFRKLAGPRAQLVLDFAWGGLPPKAHLPLLRRIEEFGIAWIEDPFQRTQIDHYAYLRNHTPIPVGCGDEVSRPADMQALIAARALDVVRLDATVIGGCTAVRELAAQALASGARVSFHEHPEVHEHCVFGIPSADHLEVFPADRPFDRVHDLIQHCAFERIENGRIAPTQTPGTGIRLRDEAIERYAKRHSKVPS